MAGLDPTSPQAATDPLAMAFAARQAAAGNQPAVGALNQDAGVQPAVLTSDQNAGAPPPPWAMNMSGGDPESLAMMGYPPTAKEPGPATAYMLGLSKSLTGGGPEGVLSKIGNLGQQQDKAAADKMAAINRAMDRINQFNAGRNVNLGEMAFGAGLLAPTRTGSFAESLGHGLSSAIPEVQQERSMNLETTRALGELGIQASDVELQNAAAAREEAMKQYQLAVEAGRGPALAEMYGSRGEGAAQIRANAAIDVAKIRAAAGNDQTAVKMIMEKYKVDQQTAVGRLNAGANQERAAAATTTAGAAKTKADKSGMLTDNETASLGNAVYNATLNDPAYLSAKSDVDKLKIYNAHRMAASLPPAATLPNAVPAAPVPTAVTPVPAPAAAPAPAPAPGAKPDINSILGIQ